MRAPSIAIAAAMTASLGAAGELRAQPAAQATRLAVPVDGVSPSRGPADALVTLVYYGDYRGPFCRRLMDSFEALHAKFKRDVRVVHKTFNLAHFNSRDASVMSCVAHRAGRWAKLEPLLWAIDRTATIDRALVTQLAREAGVKRRHIRKHWRDCERRIDLEQAEGARLGINGIPVTFINGQPMRGARGQAELEALVQAELAAAKKDIAAGRATRATYYQKRVFALGAAGPPPPAPTPDAKSVYAVPVTGDPSVGKADALVTAVIAWELFEPFSRRLRDGALSALIADGDLRVVFKHHLASAAASVHRDAHLAACAAGRQGRYLPYVEALWSRVAGDRASAGLLREIAADVGLSMAVFDADMRSTVCAQQLERDARLLSSLNAGGTPVVFINGRYISGARSLSTYEALIREERERARERVRKGARPASYYQQFVVTVGKRAP